MEKIDHFAIRQTRGTWFRTGVISAIFFVLLWKYSILSLWFTPSEFNLNAKDIIFEALETNLAGDWLKRYTSEPHLAGTNYGLVEFTANKFKEYGFKPTIDPYEIYVSYPKEHDLHLVKDGQSVYQAPLKEDILKEDATSNGTDTVPTFLGYAANGNVTSQFVYVNYGRKEDFETLKSLGVDITGKIAIARYGHNFRGLKVKFAQDAGAVGVLLYSDPGDDFGITPANGFKQYPHGPARQESSVQRGSVQFLGGVGATPGDPTTPGYASKPGVGRKDPYSSIGKIPALPISYREVKPILEKLNGHGKQVEEWKGELEGFDYFTGPNPDFELNLYNNQIYNITSLWNVYGEIEGSNTNEVIIIGNHRDAWIKGGAGDPNSGSAVLLEVARALHALQEAGYKFKRSIILQSYDGEEYGLLGSTEAGEYFARKYKKTVVAYLNLDAAVTGSNLALSASPVLNGLLRSVAKEVEYPVEGVGSLYDHFVSSGDNIHNLGSGSDYTVFLEHLGIPSVDLGFKQNEHDAVYHYHSNYDSYSWMDKFGDPGFVYHNVAAKYLTLLAYTLNEKEIIDFKLNDYAKAISSYYEKTIASVPKDWFNKNIGRDSIHDFTKADPENTQFIIESSDYNYGRQYCQINAYPELQRTFGYFNRIEKVAGTRLLQEGEGPHCGNLREKRHGMHEVDEDHPHGPGHHGDHDGDHHGPDHPHKPHDPDHPHKPHDPDHPHKPHKPDHPHKPHKPDHPHKPHDPDHPHKPHKPDHPHKPHDPDHPHKPHRPGHPHKPHRPHHNHTIGQLIDITWKDIHEFEDISYNFDLHSTDLQAQFDDRESLHWWQKIRLHFQIKRQNKLIQYFERNFLYVYGLNKRPWFKHIVYASGRYTGYAGQTLPGLNEAIEDDNYRQFVKWLGIVGQSIRRAKTELLLKKN